MEFVTLDEFLAQDDGDDVPEPDVPPTWEELVALEPGLDGLLESARSYSNGRRRRFCANHTFCWELNPKLEALVGWGCDTGPDLLRTEAAYDVARDTIYDALPDCRGCACMPRGGAW